MTPEIQTARLILRPLELADAAQVQDTFPQWEIVKHLNGRVPWPFPADGVMKYYTEATLPAIERGDEWHWTIRLRAAPERIIGSIGVMKAENNRGFWLAPEFWGQGLMTEAVIAANDFWFEVLRMPALRAPKAIVNTGSRRISEKTGMRVVATGESDYVSGRLATETWEITAEEWRAWRASHG